MSADRHAAHGAEDQPGPTRRAVDELIQRSVARPVASIEDLDRFRAVCGTPTTIWRRFCRTFGPVASLTPEPLAVVVVDTDAGSRPRKGSSPESSQSRSRRVTIMPSFVTVGGSC